MLRIYYFIYYYIFYVSIYSSVFNVHMLIKIICIRYAVNSWWMKWKWAWKHKKQQFIWKEMQMHEVKKVWMGMSKYIAFRIYNAKKTNQHQCCYQCIFKLLYKFLYKCDKLACIGINIKLIFEKIILNHNKIITNWELSILIFSLVLVPSFSYEIMMGLDRGSMNHCGAALSSEEETSP